jgi:hypothetical protein
MRTINTSGKVNQGRRQFVRTAAITVGAARFGIIRSAAAQTGGARPANLPTIKPGTNTSFGTLKQIDAGVLTVGYAEAGSADGSPVLLLHG